MAIYRLEKKSISRGNGHNLVAAVSYRAGLKLTDSNPKNTDAKTHDYSKKSDVAHSEIILTDELKKAGVDLTLEQIANFVESGEVTKRGKIKKTAKLASEYVLAGSHELTLDENIKAFREFAEQQSREQGVIAMLFVHDPKQGNDVRASKDAGDSTKSHDPRNIHAHIVVLSRQVDLTASGQLELGNKSDSELSDTGRAKKGLPLSRTWLKGVREQWANIQNKSLERHNIATVTHKSYKDLGLNIKPGIHLGKNAKALQDKGFTSYIDEHNNEIEQSNDLIIKQTANSYIVSTEQTIARATRPRPSPFDTKRQRHDDRDTEIASIDEQTEQFNRIAEQANSNARQREPTIVNADSTARQLTRRDAMMLANRYYDPRYTDEQRQYLQAFADKHDLSTGDLKKDFRQSLEFFSDQHNGIEHKSVIALLRHPEQHQAPSTERTPEPVPAQVDPTQVEPTQVEPTLELNPRYRP